MWRYMMAGALAAFVMASSAGASTMTVLGSGGGHIFYDGKDVGTIPLRLTQVPPGQHAVRVVTPGGIERSFTLSFPRDQNVNPVIDMDVELARRPGTAPAQIVETEPEDWRDDVAYRTVYPSDEEYDRYYNRFGYRPYGSYSYGAYGPYGYDSYGYGNSGYSDPYFGITPFVNRRFDRNRSSGSRSSSQSFSTPTFQGSSGTPALSQATSSPPASFQSAGTPTFQASGTTTTQATRFQSSGQARVAGQRRVGEN